MGLSSYRERSDCSRARVREENVDVTMFLFHDGIEPVQIFQARHVATTVVTFVLIEAAASFSSFSRRPVITTRAPSSTKRLAVAKPIPLLPPVMTATLTSSFS